MKNPFFRECDDIQWCPGCGNHHILKIVQKALVKAKKTPHDTVLVSGIGQAAKIPHYMNIYGFHSLHGRALPIATGVKAANPEMTVIAEGGDGDMYGEGGNHFIHAIRRNPDIVNLIHNNMVYGLTKGQASPTSSRGFVTPVQPSGVKAEPFDPVKVALALNVSFVARAYAGDEQQATGIIQAAIEHRGFAVVDILQPCVIFNKLNTYQWFKKHCNNIPEGHDKNNMASAIKLADSGLYLGIFYVNERECFEPVENDGGEHGKIKAEALLREFSK